MIYFGGCSMSAAGFISMLICWSVYYDILCALNSKWSDLEGEPADRNRINSHDGQTISCDGIWQ